MSITEPRQYVVPANRQCDGMQSLVVATARLVQCGNCSHHMSGFDSLACHWAWSDMVSFHLALHPIKRKVRPWLYHSTRHRTPTLTTDSLTYCEHPQPTTCAGWQVHAACGWLLVQQLSQSTMRSKLARTFQRSVTSTTRSVCSVSIAHHPATP